VPIPVKTWRAYSPRASPIPLAKIFCTATGTSLPSQPSLYNIMIACTCHPPVIHQKSKFINRYRAKPFKQKCNYRDWTWRQVLTWLFSLSRCYKWYVDWGFHALDAGPSGDHESTNPPGEEGCPITPQAVLEWVIYSDSFCLTLLPPPQTIHSLSLFHIFNG